MTAAEATRIALDARAEFDVRPEFKPGPTERRFIEIVQGAPAHELPGPGPVRDVVAWVVRLQAGIAWAEFAVSERTGKVVRFRRSR